MVRIPNWLIPLLLAASLADTQPSIDPLSSLQARLDAHVNEDRFGHAQWGVQVVSLDTGTVLYQHNADKLMKPASNAKLYTAALALDRLGPDYRIKTSFYAAAKPDADGVIHGDLIVYGRGDPSFSARFNDGDYRKPCNRRSMHSRLPASGGLTAILWATRAFFMGRPTAPTGRGRICRITTALRPRRLLSGQCDRPRRQPGRGGWRAMPIIAMPATAFVTFSNRTETVEKKGRARIRIYRPLGRNLAYLWGGVPLGSSESPTLFQSMTPRCGLSRCSRRPSRKAASWFPAPCVK